jgi:hypothetical protein
MGGLPLKGSLGASFRLNRSDVKTSWGVTSSFLLTGLLSPLLLVSVDDLLTLKSFEVRASKQYHNK